MMNSIAFVSTTAQRIMHDCAQKTGKTPIDDAGARNPTDTASTVASSFDNMVTLPWENSFGRISVTFRKIHGIEPPCQRIRPTKG